MLGDGWRGFAAWWFVPCCGLWLAQCCFIVGATLFDVEYSGQIKIINLLNDDCNLEGFTFKQV